jgi:oxazoline/thiazoline synthase
MLYFGASDGGGPRMAIADSNGNAAGTSLTDAILRGLLELIERDAVALWWYNRTRQPPIDLDACRDPWIGELRETYAAMGREIWALDLTSDLDVPVVAALSRRTEQRRTEQRRTGHPREDIVFGFGADPQPETALRKALTELNQVLVAVFDPEDDSARVKMGVDAARWWDTATLANQEYLQPQGNPRAYPAPPKLDAADAVEAIHARLREEGLELLALDMTRPDIGLPVAKVIVPGLRPMWARLGPGRLYDVPVKLGRIAKPTPFEDLNPLPLFV